MGLKQQWAALGTGVKVLIGLVLLVGLIPLLVITAAVVASFVLATGDGGASAAPPQATFECDYGAEGIESPSELPITRGGGDDIEASNSSSRSGQSGSTGRTTQGQSNPVKTPRSSPDPTRKS